MSCWWCAVLKLILFQTIVATFLMQFPSKNLHGNRKSSKASQTSNLSKNKLQPKNYFKEGLYLNLLRILRTWWVKIWEAVERRLQGKLYSLSLEAGHSTRLLGTLSRETIDLDTDLEGSTLRLTESSSLKSGSVSGSLTWKSLLTAALILPPSSIKGLTAHLYQNNFHRKIRHHLILFQTCLTSPS